MQFIFQFHTCMITKNAPYQLDLFWTAVHLPNVILSKPKHQLILIPPDSQLPPLTNAPQLHQWNYLVLLL